VPTRLRNLALRLLGGFAVSFAALLVSDAWIAGVSVTTASAVFASILMVVLLELLDLPQQWLQPRATAGVGAAQAGYSVLLAFGFLWPFALLPVAAVLLPGLELATTRAYLLTSCVVVAVGLGAASLYVLRDRRRGGG
jgi:hypothetical protein